MSPSRFGAQSSSGHGSRSLRPSDRISPSLASSSAAPGIADEETYPVLQAGVFEKSDSVSHDLLARQRAKPARRHTRVPAQIRRQMSLIGIARLRRDLRETFSSKRNLPQRAAETPNGCISLGRKSGA